MSEEPGTGRSKGFCFLEFSEPQFAEASMIMNGMEVAGRKIKVGRPTQGASSIAAANLTSTMGIGIAPPVSVSINQLNSTYFTHYYCMIVFCGPIQSVHLLTIDKSIYSSPSSWPYSTYSYCGISSSVNNNSSSPKIQLCDG